MSCDCVHKSQPRGGVSAVSQHSAKSMCGLPRRTIDGVPFRTTMEDRTCIIILLFVGGAILFRFPPTTCRLSAMTVYNEQLKIRRPLDHFRC